jgi:hypothetical protein
VLAGEDVNQLARRFNLEPCYARRHARRVLDRTVRERPHTALLAPAPRSAVPEELGPLEYACLLLGARVRPARNGYYELDGNHAGPKEVTREANHILRGRGLREIPYPGLVPYAP